jgi:hypothetical protein
MEVPVRIKVINVAQNSTSESDVFIDRTPSVHPTSVWKRPGEVRPLAEAALVFFVIVSAFGAFAEVRPNNYNIFDAAPFILLFMITLGQCVDAVPEFVSRAVIGLLTSRYRPDATGILFPYSDPPKHGAPLDGSVHLFMMTPPLESAMASCPVPPTGSRAARSRFSIRTGTRALGGRLDE